MSELTITVPALAVDASDANDSSTGNITVNCLTSNAEIFIMNKPNAAAITVTNGVVAIDSNHVSFSGKYGQYDIGEATFNSTTKVLTIPVTYTGSKASFINAVYESQLHILAVDSGINAFASLGVTVTPSAAGTKLLQLFHDVSRNYTKKSIIRRLNRKASASLNEATLLASNPTYADIFEALGYTADNFTETLVNYSARCANPRSLVIACLKALDGSYDKTKGDAILGNGRSAYDIYNGYVDYLASQQIEEVVENVDNTGGDNTGETNNEVTDPTPSGDGEGDPDNTNPPAEDEGTPK